MTDDETQQTAAIGARERATLDGLRTQITELHRAVRDAKALAAKHLGDAERFRVERNAAREVAERAQADASTAQGEVMRLRAALALSQESLAAAVRGERVTVVDEVARLTRERAVLADAVREYVAASDAHEQASRAGGTVESYVESAARIVATTEALRALVSR